MPTSINASPVTPFLKWAGGKRWLVKQAPELLPQGVTRYIEPFLGSGAIFFHVQPKNAILADINPELIGTYNALKTNWRLVNRYLKHHQSKHSHDYYYEVRDRTPKSIYSAAARMIYLNRTCWNGLYRVNLDGKFNVPKGTKDRVILDTDDFELVANLLAKAEILLQDFETTIARAQEGDFVFIDPPYVPEQSSGGFAKYTDKVFSWNDQLRLHKAISAAGKRGAKILLTNVDEPSIRRLYRGLGETLQIDRASVISGKNHGRGEYSEVIIRIN